MLQIKFQSGYKLQHQIVFERRICLKVSREIYSLVCVNIHFFMFVKKKNIGKVSVKQMKNLIASQFVIYMLN